MSSIPDPLQPVDEFYQVTERDLAGGSGHLIRHEPLKGYVALDEAAATYRVLYQSTGDTDPRFGGRIGVSGIIAFPDGEVPADGWPVVSWAHGTVGSADKCAPSMDSDKLGKPADEGLGLLRKINKAPHKLLNAFLRAGWAVAMTDYEGLGTYGNHPYLLGRSEGRGILDIVPAVRQLSEETVGQRIAEQYAIVGHSQGGQAALFAAHLAAEYETETRGRLIGVAALAPASNLKGGLNPETDGGLLLAYQSPEPVGDLGAFYALFSNGVFGGDPDIDKTQIFQDWALAKYLQDYDTKARAELSQDPDWMERAPLDAETKEDGIFRTQLGDLARRTAWQQYWAQVDGFTPSKEIAVPIRISQARGDKRVLPAKTEKLLGQLRDIPGQGPITEVFYDAGDVATPDPATLGDHFGLLADDDEIDALVGWIRRQLIGR